MTADPYYSNLDAKIDPGDISLTVTDDDDSAILNVPNFNITEGLPAFNFYVNLKSVPYATVTIQVSQDSFSWFEISTNQISWTPAQWNETRVVAVQSTLFDLVDDGPRNANIYLKATSADEKYVVNRRVIPFTEADNDFAGLNVNLGSFSNGIPAVTEGDAPSLVLLKLTSEPQPGTIVRIDLSVDAALSVSPQTFTFNPVNWNTFQRMYVGAVDDSIVTGTRLALVQFQISTQDTQYAIYSPPVLNVTVFDNDHQNVTMTVDKLGATLCPSTPCGGVQLTIGPNVLGPQTEVAISVKTVAAPGAAGQPGDLPQFATALPASGVYSFEPHGTTFPAPVQIALQYDPTAARPNDGESFAVFRRAGPDADSWTRMAATFQDGLASVSVTSFSFYYVGIVQGPQTQANTPPSGSPAVVKAKYNFIFWIVVGVGGALLIAVLVVVIVLLQARNRNAVAPEKPPKESAGLGLDEESGLGKPQAQGGKGSGPIGGGEEPAAGDHDGGHGRAAAGSGAGAAGVLEPDQKPVPADGNGNGHLVLAGAHA